jgi:hypothetical protein
VNPPGDIPDNQVFVPFQSPDGKFVVKVPEGWARASEQGAVTFTDKYNTIRIDTTPAAAAPTVASATASEVPAIQQSQPAVAPGKVSMVTRKAGPAVLITYQADSPTNPVTGKVARLDVERYEFWHNGTEVILTLSGPTGSDNVDPWRTVTDSLRFT